MSKDRWTKYRLGGLPDPSSAIAPRLQADRTTRLPAKADLRANCSAVEDQGELGSCAACAVVGALEYLSRRPGNGPARDFSRLFLYYNGRAMAGAEKEDAGLITSHAIAAALAYGMAPEENWPYVISKFKQRPPEDVFDSALVYNGVQYAQTPRGDTVRAALANGFPVVFRYFGDADLIRDVQTSGRMAPWGNQSAPVDKGGHTMLIVGYDDDVRHVIVRNSWGADFGDRGYFTMPYDVLEATTHENEFWTVGQLSEESVRSLRLTGASTSESIEHTQRNAPAQYAESLSQLRQDVRKEVQDHVDDAKKSIRDRLRAQEDKLGKPDGGGNG